jgi:tRNA threonylcarbamoyl adenosine modification protein YeaZ
VSGPVTLAIATAGPVAAALVADDTECASATSGQALDGTLRCALAALQSCGKTLDDVGLIAVCNGPGSFTGLRIGVAFAKSVAQGRALPIVGVSSYDVADSDAQEDSFPRIALVAGKRDYFYARVRDGVDVPPRFAHGTSADLAGLLKEGTVQRLSDVTAAEQALRVGRIGRRLAGQGAGGDWRAVDIDYGQRPNAVINWEARGRRAERGGTPSASNFKRQ